ncbi:MAG: DUF3857 domain-containing protein, partial [Pyrinomonadaceae bacterium]
MRFLLSIFLSLSFVTLSADAQRKGGSPSPKRTRPAVTLLTEAPPPPPAKSEDKSLGTVVESYVTNYDLNADGTGTEVRAVQQRCFSAGCLARVGSSTQIFNGDLQRVTVLDAYVLKSDGTKLKVPASAITDRPTDQTEAAPGFSSLREFEVKFADVKIGDAVYIKTQITTIRPTFDGRFDALELFPLFYDWKSIEINVTGPAGFPLFIEAFGLDGGKLADDAGRSRWQYKKSNLARLEIEPVMTEMMTISPRFALTTFKDFDALGRVFWESLKKSAVVTPEIQTLANQITKDSTTPIQQASAIYAWVNKNIRYLSVVLDRGGVIPHTSSEIIKNGYGDCKDYTTIIHTLLKVKGIDSIPVLIRSDVGDWFPSVATADYFNHAILYIPSIDLFADATTPNTRLGLIPQTLVGKHAVLAGEKTGVITLPKDNPAENQILSEMTLDFAENGSVKALTKNTFVGRSEIIFRPLFSSPTIKRESETLVRIMLAYFGIKGEGSITSIGDPHNVGEPFAVGIESRIENFTTFLPNGRLEIPPGLNMLSMASMAQLVTTESRKTSVIVGAAIFRETVALNLPPTVKINSAPQAVNFANGVGIFRITSELKDGTLRYTRELVFKKDVVEAGEYSLLKEMCLVIIIPRVA